MTAVATSTSLGWKLDVIQWPCGEAATSLSLVFLWSFSGAAYRFFDYLITPLKRLGQSVLWPMMSTGMIRKFVIALTSLAFVAGATLQAAPPSMASMAVSKQVTSIPTQNRADMATDNTAAPTPMKVPCQGMTPECVKAMGCLGSLSLPVQPTLLSNPIHYERIAFWSEDEVPMSLAVEPLLFPPIPA